MAATIIKPTSGVITIPSTTGTLATLADVTSGGSFYGTAVAAASQTSIDFTSLPSTVKKLTMFLQGMSLDGSSQMQIQIGDSGGVETSGYNGNSVRIGGVNAYNAWSAGVLVFQSGNAVHTFNGSITFEKVTGNVWLITGITSNQTTTGENCVLCGDKTLSDTLDRIRLTTVNGTDTFDAGTVNIMYWVV